MSDSYQAIYDAVRSRISGGNIGDAVSDALRNAFSGVDHHLQCITQDFCIAAAEQQRPSVLFRPVLSQDGDMFCALYGGDLVNGCAGFGDTPAKAMAEFDVEWFKSVRNAA